jgi:3-hydroxybutyryl-CoA dehydrogenase
VGGVLPRCALHTVGRAEGDGRQDISGKAGRGFYDYTEGAAKPLPAAEPAQRALGRIEQYGALRMGGALAPRLASAGQALTTAFADARFGGALRIGDDAWLVPGDGRTATAIAAQAGVPMS